MYIEDLTKRTAQTYDAKLWERLGEMNSFLSYCAGAQRVVDAIRNQFTSAETTS